MIISIFVLSFVVKQKTTYEMRISDWSSDVCSPDLLGQLVAVDGAVVVGGSGRGTAIAQQRPGQRQHQHRRHDAGQNPEHHASGHHVLPGPSSLAASSASRRASRASSSGLNASGSTAAARWRRKYTKTATTPMKRMRKGPYHSKIGLGLIGGRSPPKAE